MSYERKAAFKSMLAVMKERDRIVLEAIERLTGNVPTPKQCRERGTRSIDTFGNETYYWDGKIIVEFPKQDHVVNRPDDFDFYYTVEQRYRLHV